VYGHLPFLPNLAASPFVNAPKIDRGQVELNSADKVKRGDDHSSFFSDLAFLSF